MRRREQMLLYQFFIILFICPSLATGNEFLDLRRIRISEKISLTHLLPQKPSYDGIYNWRLVFENLAQQRPADFENVKVGILQDGKLIYEFSLNAPRPEAVDDYSLVEKYVSVIIQNMLAVYGGSEVLLQANQDLIKGVSSYLLEEGSEGRASFGKYLSQVYGKFNIGQIQPGDIESLQRGSVESVSAIDPSKIKGYYLGIDMGASSIKVVLVEDGKIVKSADYDYSLEVEGRRYRSSGEYKFATDYLKRLQDILDEFIIDKKISLWKEIKGIGLSWAGAVDEKGEIAGRAKIVKSLNDNEFKKIQQIGKLLASRTGKPVAVVNDGFAGAFWAGSRGGEENALVLGVGTSLAGGYVDQNGEFPLYLLELAKATVDMSSTAYYHGSTNLQGVLQQYLSLKGALNLAEKNGFVFPSYLKREDEKFRYLKEEAEKGNTSAQVVFTTLGLYLADAITELRNYLDFDKVILFGGMFSPVRADSRLKFNVRNHIINTARISLKSRNYDIKIIPPSRSAKDEARFSASLGAIYRVFAGAQYQPPSIGIGNYKIDYRGLGYSFLDPFQTKFPANEVNLEKELGGPNIAYRFEEFIENKDLSHLLSKQIPDVGITLEEAFDEIRRIKDLLDKRPEDLPQDQLKSLDAEAKRLEDIIVSINKFITEEAKTNEDVKNFLKDIGKKFGYALGFYLFNIRKILMENGVDEEKANDLISRIVLVGGVAENLGKGLTNDPLINQGVKIGVEDIFKKLGLTHISPDIKRSEYKGEFPRDFWAFLPKNEDEYSITIAVGGTKIQAGSVDKHGNLLTKDENGKPRIFGGSWKGVLTAQQILPEDKPNSKNAIIDYIVKLIKEVKQNTDVSGKTPVKIGISWAGPGEYWNGIVKAPNIWGFDEEPVNLIEELRERLPESLKNIEIEIQHDGIAAARGEISPQGTYSQEENLVAVIWGTGIGAGLLLDKNAYYDYKIDANYIFRQLGLPLGEIGHHIIFVKR